MILIMLGSTTHLNQFLGYGDSFHLKYSALFNINAEIVLLLYGRRFNFSINYGILPSKQNTCEIFYMTDRLQTRNFNYVW